VRSGAARDDTVIVIECFNPFLSFDYKTATMLEVQKQNKRACAPLNELGFNGDGSLGCKASIFLNHCAHSPEWMHFHGRLSILDIIFSSKSWPKPGIP
jgi:hypothetical protein